MALTTVLISLTDHIMFTPARLLHNPRNDGKSCTEDLCELCLMLCYDLMLCVFLCVVICAVNLLWNCSAESKAISLCAQIKYAIS